MNELVTDVCGLFCCKLAVGSEEQIAEYRGITSRTGRRHLAARLSGMVQNGLLRRFRLLAKPTPALGTPLLELRPGDPIGDMAALSWRLEKRWNVEPKMTTVYMAGPRCRKLYGTAPPHLANMDAVGHDLALTALYLRLCHCCPERARDWVPDWERKATLEYGQKLPDVLLYNADGMPYLAIEIAGIYPPSRLIGLQVFCAETLQLPLEIW